MALVPSYIASLPSYPTASNIDDIQRKYGLSRVVKLASNENPLGPSPLAIEAICHSAAGINRYPDGGRALREVLAREYGVKVANVITNSGSEAIMANIIRTFLCDDDEVLTTEGAFVGFQLLARSRGIPYRTVPYRNWRYDLPALADAITAHTKIVYLANPNNPTGTFFTRQEFDDFHRRVPERVLIILDEAYFEYAKDNPLYPDSMDYRYDNVITLRSFSKVYGLAGARIGYAFAHEDLIANLLKVKLPFEPASLASAAGIAALGDRAFLARSLETNQRGMRALTKILKNLDIEFVPSQANFVFTVWPSEEEAAAMAQGLLEQGVIVRPLTFWGLPRAVRISVGTEEQIQFLERALERSLRRETCLSQ